MVMASRAPHSTLWWLFSSLTKLQLYRTRLLLQHTEPSRALDLITDVSRASRRGPSRFRIELLDVEESPECRETPQRIALPQRVALASCQELAPSLGTAERPAGPAPSLSTS